MWTKIKSEVKSAVVIYVIQQFLYRQKHWRCLLSQPYCDNKGVSIRLSGWEECPARWCLSWWGDYYPRLRLAVTTPRWTTLAVLWTLTRHSSWTDIQGDIDNILCVSVTMTVLPRYIPAAISIKHLLDHGKTANQLGSFLFLKKEIPTRLANMIKELQLLPPDLKKQKECSQILNDYISSFRSVLCHNITYYDYVYLRILRLYFYVQGSVRVQRGRQRRDRPPA